jgi:peptide/nickel transport system ATP-binding protein
MGEAAGEATGKRDVLRVENLVVDYLLDAGRLRAVDGVSFAIAAGEIFGLVGESGSGKSTLALALPRLLLPPAVISGGRVVLSGRDLLSLNEEQLRAARGREVSLVPQSGMNALNPLHTVGQQIADAIRVHERLGGKAARSRAADLVEQLGLPRAAAGSYAHELSGGMRQRAVIALALALRPALLIMDEPTAALDVMRQREILAHILALQAKLGFSVLFISHDLALTLALCNRVGVLHRGALVETAPARALWENPQHPYTRELMGAFLTTKRPLPAPEKSLSSIASAPLLSVRGLCKTFVSGWGGKARRVRAVDDVSFDVSAGEAIALVGESGSGKSTIVRMVARLIRPGRGEIRWKDRNVLAEEPGRASLAYRSGVQMIFQDPFAALNPARRVDYHLERPLRLHARLRDRAELSRRVEALLENVGLGPAREIAGKYPHQLSGGQRQRVIIARALAVEPALVLADEPASMLDASIRVEVVATLRRLKIERGLACIYVTHDLSGARALADRILVLLAGQIVESGPTAPVLDAPAHPFTALLLAARPDPAHPGRFDRWERMRAPGSEAPPAGSCAFVARCPRAVDHCGNETPELREIAPGRLVRCFRPLIGSQLP